MKKNFAFARRGPDQIAEELARVLSEKVSYEFNALFLIVWGRLKARNAASAGEEMLRLRAYEKLQSFVQTGAVKKTGKEYKGAAVALTTFLNAAAELNARLASDARDRSAIQGRKAVGSRKPAIAKP